MTIGFNAYQPFQEQIDFFKQKTNIPTQKWTDVFASAHDKAFMVAGAQKAELLDDLRLAVEKTMTEGKGIFEFRREFDRIVEKHGWTGWKGEGKQAISSKNYLDHKGTGWRSNIIYQTNLSTSYAAGRWQQLNDPDLLKLRPYWKYVHSDSVKHPRPLHVSWNGLVLKHDDPFWATHFPPNGWLCHCRVTAVRPKDYKGDIAPDDGTYTKTINGVDHVIPNGIDAGFNYAMGGNLNKSVADFVANKLIKYPTKLAQMVKTDLSKLLLSASDNALTTVPDMKIIDLEAFVPVQKTVSELAVKKPEWFPEGFNGIQVVDRKDIFAAYYQGSFYVSNTDALITGFNPALELSSAFEKMTLSKTLSFNEEYAVECLWHEMMHARTGVFPLRQILGEEPLSEGMVQLAARYTYPVLVTELGGLASHQAAILKNGYAYSVVTANLIELINQAGVAGKDIEVMLLQHGNDYLEPLKALLSAGLKTKRVGLLLNAANKFSLEQFKQKIIVQQKNAPL